ncbi:histidine phosphatase superfamily [Crassisporium funariophilum]|nr:histidine phosphatase superfamily [Crassisporium funariophilum]
MATSNTSAAALESHGKTIARIYLVRHGETQYNRDGIIQGHIDIPLNEGGVEQARIVGDALKGVDFDVAYSSDLKRAADTGQQIMVHHPKVKMIKQPELRERFMGDLEGTSPKKGAAKLVASVDDTMETSAAFRQRATKWWNRTVLGTVLSSPRDDGAASNVLVATHGGFILVLVQELIGSRKARCGPGVVIWKCNNASVSVIEVKEDKTGVVVQFGSVAHLSADEETSADFMNL